MAAPLRDGRLGSIEDPFGGTIALDGNLTASLLADIAADPAFAAADLRIAPASPGKADRLLPLLTRPQGGSLRQPQRGRSAGAPPLRKRAPTPLGPGGTRRAACAGDRRRQPGSRGRSSGDSRTAQPPSVLVTRVTGAGDTFMAAHLRAEREGVDRDAALHAALAAAAAYVAGGQPG